MRHDEETMAFDFLLYKPFDPFAWCARSSLHAHRHHLPRSFDDLMIKKKLREPCQRRGRFEQELGFGFLLSWAFMYRGLFCV